MNEPLFEFIDVQQHVDGVELNVDVELIENTDRDVVLGARLYVQCGTEGSQVAGRQADVTRRTNFAALDAEFFIILTVKLVRQYAHIRKDGQRTIRNHADRQELIGQSRHPGLIKPYRESVVTAP